MKRYDLVCRRVDGYAQASVEEHKRGAYVKYAEHAEKLAELEAELTKANKGIAELKKLLGELVAENVINEILKDERIEKLEKENKILQSHIDSSLAKQIANINAGDI